MAGPLFLSASGGDCTAAAARAFCENVLARWWCARPAPRVESQAADERWVLAYQDRKDRGSASDCAADVYRRLDGALVAVIGPVAGAAGGELVVLEWVCADECEVIDVIALYLGRRCACGRLVSRLDRAQLTRRAPIDACGPLTVLSKDRGSTALATEIARHVLDVLEAAATGQISLGV